MARIFATQAAAGRGVGVRGVGSVWGGGGARARAPPGDRCGGQGGRTERAARGHGALTLHVCKCSGHGDPGRRMRVGARMVARLAAAGPVCGRAEGDEGTRTTS